MVLESALTVSENIRNWREQSLPLLGVMSLLANLVRPNMLSESLILGLSHTKILLSACCFNKLLLIMVLRNERVPAFLTTPVLISITNDYTTYL